MSTRRARIKAIASLPVRRKNNENNSAKPKPSPKQITENLTSTYVENNETVVENTEVQNAEVPVGNKTVFTPKRSSKTATPNLIGRGGTPKSLKLKLNSPALLNKHESPIRPVALITNINNFNKSLSKPKTPITNDNHTPNIVGKLELNTTKDVNTNSKETGCNTKIVSYDTVIVNGNSTEEDVLDGIVPLQSTRNVPKPLDLLKNEIISENAEVFFDPIVPLPSPSKVRPKLRPAPRLPFRRNSIQGSASESEDESRKALQNSSGTPGPSRQRQESQTSHSTQHTLVNRETNRVRNDSVCSSASQVFLAQPGPSSSKEKQALKIKRTEASRRMAALKRKQRLDTVPRDTLTMYDLIFYNPIANPIVLDEDETTVIKEQEVQKTEKDVQKKEKEEITKAKMEDPSEVEAAAPVPQIKLGPNGEIILDEKSLVIEQTESQRKLSSTVVHESYPFGSRGVYTRNRRSTDWSDAETVRFYRALAAVGTDFTLMTNMFPDRTRRELKVKFKKEERNNSAQVDKALRSQIQWDATRLRTEFAEERRKAAEKAEEEKLAFLTQKKAERERLKINRNDGLRYSKASKAIEVNSNRQLTETETSENTADDFIRRAIEAKKELKLAKGAPSPASPQKRSIPKLKPVPKSPTTKTPNMPKNIESGSLVVLAVNDPHEPSKKILQTYISRGPGRMSPVALPSFLLNSVVTYINNGTPKSTSGPSPQLTSPGSVGSQESRNSVIQINPSPAKRGRFDSFTMTPL